jgi:alpha-tubulin suppressor-like RCC1 family protein
MPFIKKAIVLVGKPYSPAPVVLGSIAAGYYFNVYLANTGRVFTWGSNAFGQLGDNSITNRTAPASVLGTTKTFCKILTGQYHSIGLDKNGMAWGWGLNSSGQLGDNTATNRYTPVSVIGTTKTFCEIANGNLASHNLVIDKYGKIWGWGSGAFGRLGNNSTLGQFTPVSIYGTNTFCKVTVGAVYSVGIDKNGRLWSWGRNANGQLGDNTITSRITPVSVAGTIKTFCKVSAGNLHTHAIDKNGRLWGWGINTFGQLGDNTSSSRRTPVSVLGLVKTFCEISAGTQHTLAIDKNGRLWSWGYGKYGVLGNNDSTQAQKNTPVSVLGTVKTFCKIWAGNFHNIAIDYKGKTWAWGYNLYGIVSNSNVEPKTTPISVTASKTFCKIFVGNQNGIGLTNNGEIFTWGLNDFGQIGDNTGIGKYNPVSIAGSTKTFCQIVNGYASNYAIDRYGRIWSWGDNTSGKLGDNSITNRFTPISILGTTKTFCKISTGFQHTAAIDQYGRIWSWGYNFYGQIGDSTTVSKRTPVAVLGALKTFCEISSQNNQTMAIDKNGRIWGWGHNQGGRLGIGAVLSTRTPRAILGVLKTFCKISSGADFGVAIDKNGKVWGWGSNGSGQLGDNSGGTYTSPISVYGTKTFCKIVAGDLSVLAIDKNGKLWAWGDNTDGQLGDGTTTARCTPVAVAGLAKTFCEIAAYRPYANSIDFHSAAIDQYGKMWAWGVSVYGGRGDGSIPVLTPISVCGL